MREKQCSRLEIYDRLRVSEQKMSVPYPILRKTLVVLRKLLERDVTLFGRLGITSLDRDTNKLKIKIGADNVCPLPYFSFSFLGTFGRAPAGSGSHTVAQL